jgi:hypothetical protein
MQGKTKENREPKWLIKLIASRWSVCSLSRPPYTTMKERRWIGVVGLTKDSQKSDVDGQVFRELPPTAAEPQSTWQRPCKWPHEPEQTSSRIARNGWLRVNAHWATRYVAPYGHWVCLRTPAASTQRPPGPGNPGRNLFRT